MIKVELFYKVSMFDTDWMMTAEEYQEFRESTFNLPIAIIYPRTEPEKYIPAIKSAYQDQAEECPDYIEPPAPEVVCENGACTLVLPEEKEVTEFPPEVAESPAKVTKKPEKVTKKPEKEQEPDEKSQKLKPQLDRDYTPYINMLVNDEKPANIRKKMMKDFGITEGTANTYYYAKVRPEAEIIKAENEEKAKVETVEEKKPAPGKYFTDEERLRIQKKLGLK